ncbi:MAG TPA: class I SAM-dependent methyltransferase [Rhizomicrobium sp.]|nr:class I SAM-dependent methyltransferase [Rhizomicrobium sp.]
METSGSENRNGILAKGRAVVGANPQRQTVPETGLEAEGKSYISWHWSKKGKTPAMNWIKSAVKPLIPRCVKRYIKLSKAAKTLREVYYGRQLKALKPTIFATGETHNFTYDLTDENLRYLAETIAVATNKRPAEIETFIEEAINDTGLRSYFDSKMAAYHGQQSPKGVRSPFSRRLGWYAVTRTIKPRLIIETGVERGHGALMLCAALLKNRDEGFTGHYIGTDIDIKAGWLLTEPYSQMGKVLFGDSIASLKTLSGPVDLFINDSDHSAEYEAWEYEVIAPLLSSRALILGDNAHVTDKLARFSRRMERHFLMFDEKPKDHWYPGAGIGISFPRSPDETAGPHL